MVWRERGDAEKGGFCGFFEGEKEGRREEREDTLKSAMGIKEVLP